MSIVTIVDSDKIRNQVERYYTGKLRSYGATPKGVDWNSSESQVLRFKQLTHLIDFNAPYTITDFGCGYGALIDYLELRKTHYSYYGFDVSADMVKTAEHIHGNLSHCRFTTDFGTLTATDYTVASGIFNVRMDIHDEIWWEYIIETLQKLDLLSSKGFSFNALTKYSDPEYMRPDLFYADPNQLFDYCKRTFSKFVALLHDYPLYEFTILVRKES